MEVALAKFQALNLSGFSLRQYRAPEVILSMGLLAPLLIGGHEWPRQALEGSLCAMIMSAPGLHEDFCGLRYQVESSAQKLQLQMLKR